MTRDDLQSRILDLSVWQRGGERAPHKPLLLLWALGRCAAGEDRLVSYEDVDAGVKPLLQEFGPPRKSYHTEYPFWYLRNDGLWEVQGVAEAKVREGKASQPTKGELVRVGATGGLVPEAYEALRADAAFLHQVASQLVDAHFPGIGRVGFLLGRRWTCYPEAMRAEFEKAVWEIPLGELDRVAHRVRHVDVGSHVPTTSRALNEMFLKARVAEPSRHSLSYVPQVA